MLQREFTIENKLGLHARAAAKFVTLAIHSMARITFDDPEKLLAFDKRSTLNRLTNIRLQVVVLPRMRTAIGKRLVGHRFQLK